MRIVTVGTGGVGGYFGGLLAREGHAVTFMARGEHLRAIRAHGLRVHSVHGDFHIQPAAATDRAAEVGPVDWVLLAVKTYQVEAALDEIQPLIGPQTSILTLQNGVETPDRVAARFGEAAVVPGAVWVVSAVEAPGVIRQASQFRRLAFGEREGDSSPRVRALHAAFQATGAQVEVAADIFKILWTKFVFIAAFSGLSSVLRLPAGEVRRLPETRAVLAAALREVAEVGRAKGVALEADIVEKTLDFVAGFEPSTTSSMQRDLAAGRRLEVDTLNGYVARAGRELGIPTPANDFIYAVLKPHDLLAEQAAG